MEMIGYCNSCLNNAHKKVKMVRRFCISTDEKGYWGAEAWVCPECGSVSKY